MTHMRYWAMSVGVAVSGALIAISRFAFAPVHAIWILFGLAIAAVLLSLAATAVALLRENHAFSGLSALSALIAAWTIIATRTFTASSALWLAFAGGLALLLVSLRALALHETTVERVVHALELDGSGDGTLAIRPGAAKAVDAASTPRNAFEISAVMRAWMRWLGYTGLALAGAFVVLATFAWQNPAQGVSVRWLSFGVGIAAASVALTLLLERSLAVRDEGLDRARLLAVLITAASAIAGIALVVLMALLHGSDARWWAFGLGAGLAGASLVAATIHELSSERVRHELEIAHATPTTAEAAVAAN